MNRTKFAIECMIGVIGLVSYYKFGSSDDSIYMKTQGIDMMDTNIAKIR